MLSGPAGEARALDGWHVRSTLPDASGTPALWDEGRKPLSPVWEWRGADVKDSDLACSAQRATRRDVLMCLCYVSAGTWCVR